MTKKRAQQKRGWSITAVVAVCMCLIAVFGWIVLAAEYAKEVEGVKFRGYVTPGGTTRGQAMGSTLVEAVCGAIDASINGAREIANAPSVFLFEAAPDVGVIATETATLVEQALMTLPAQRRTVVVMRIWNGFSYSEIAGILECEESTVRSHMFHGLASLRKYLEPRMRSC